MWGRRQAVSAVIAHKAGVCLVAQHSSKRCLMKSTATQLLLSALSQVFPAEQRILEKGAGGKAN
jgi:hypothetical protein